MATIKTKADYYKPTKYFEPTQPNPTQKVGHGTKGDCVIRAFSIAANITWLEAFDILVEHARKKYNVPNDKHNYTAVFRLHGYVEGTVKVERGQKRMTAEDFAKQHKTGRYILRLAHHLCAVVDGKIRDSWNCGNKCVYKYYKIQ